MDDMSAIVIRTKNTELDPQNPLDRMQLSIPWPEGGVSAYRRFPRDPWVFTTKADLLRRRRERMEANLRLKREYGIVQRRLLYVWVFWCPGVGGFAFRGWWISLVGINIDFECKYFERTKMCSGLMELFPLVEKPLFGFGPPDIEKWKKR